MPLQSASEVSPEAPSGLIPFSSLFFRALCGWLWAILLHLQHVEGTQHLFGRHICEARIPGYGTEAEAGAGEKQPIDLTTI